MPAPLLASLIARLRGLMTAQPASHRASGLPSTRAAARPGESLFDGYGPGQIVSHEGGPVPIAAELRRMVAITADGTLHHTKAATTSSLFSNLEFRLREEGWLYRKQPVSDADLRRLQEGGIGQKKSSPLVTDFVTLLTEAWRSGASDIHIHDAIDGVLIEARINNSLVELVRYPARQGAELLQSLWVQLERGNYLPGEAQTARLSRDLLPGLPPAIESLRMTHIPVEYGHASAVIRLNTDDGALPDIATLRLVDDHEAEIERLMALRVGISLFCGPPNQGKNSTMLAIMLAVRKGEIEDGRRKSYVALGAPVERRIPGFKQIALDTERPLTERLAQNAGILSAVQKYDFDKLAFEEISGSADVQLLMSAVQAGRQVFATAHVGISEQASRKLLAYGLPPHLAELVHDATAITAIVSQRLPVHLCPDCRQPIFREAGQDPARLTRSQASLDRLLKQSPELERLRPLFMRRGGGCATCRPGDRHFGVAGELGRIPILEIVFPDAGWMELVERGSFAEAREYWLRKGNLSLREHGWRRALAGEIDPTELQEIGALFDQGDVDILLRLARAPDLLDRLIARRGPENARCAPQPGAPQPRAHPQRPDPSLTLPQEAAE